jgi:hypothetical protein
VRQSKDSIVGVHDEDYSSVEENTFVDFWLLEAELLETLGKVMVLNSSGLLLTVEILEQLQNVCFAIAVFRFNSSR